MLQSTIKGLPSSPLLAGMISTLCLLVATLPASARDQPIENVTVTASTPVSLDSNLKLAAAPVQRSTREAIEHQRATSLTDLLNQVSANVTVNEAQGNPLQADLQYRGFVASPLLGLPQGLAVYLDSVRINEPFGDTVNWSLIPQAALEAVQLMPGSNPLYGLNTLGGAIALQTRDGSSGRELGLELASGSFGRRSTSLHAGGTHDSWHGFAAAERFEEEGWRDYSPSATTSLFLSGGWTNETTRFDLTLLHADTDLIGNGASPIELLAVDRSAIYTQPDQTRNELTQFTLRGKHVFQSGLALRGSAYRRDSDIRSLNGDDSDIEPCEDDPTILCEEEDEFATDLNDNAIPAVTSLTGATLNRTATGQESQGFNVEAKWEFDSATGRNGSFILGLGRDEADIHFGAGTELGTLDATRRAIGGGVFLGEAITDLKTEVSNDSVYAALGIPFSKTLLINAAARYNRTDVSLRDQLGTALNGDHAFSRLNPSVGATWLMNDRLTLYASYAESNRAPSPVELTCADEDDPCRLPNAFLADPPLDDVVASTVEGGLRLSAGSINITAGLFRTINEDDILFISAGAFTNEGFFDNVGDTRRQGIEVTASGGSDALQWSLAWARLDATFEEPFAVASENHPLASDSEINVRAGDRLPLVPQTTAKAALSWSAKPFTVSLQLRHVGGIHYRGDEANLLPKFGSATLASVRSEYQLNPHLMLMLDVDNLLDKEFETFGVFGEADEVLGDEFENPAFRTPGAPRAIYVGMRVSF